MKLLLSGSTLLNSMLRNVLFYRQSKAGSYDCPEVNCEEYLSWTASEGSTGVRTTIIEQVQLLKLCWKCGGLRGGKFVYACFVLNG